MDIFSINETDRHERQALFSFFPVANRVKIH